MTDPTPPTAIPWYKSQIFVSAVVSGIAQILARFHIAAWLTTDDIGQIVNGVLDIISFGAVAYAASARVTQKATPTLTATPSQADKINAATPPPPTLPEPPK